MSAVIRGQFSQFFSTPLPFMMKHFHIRSFHASHQLNLQPMDNEREYLPWMSDPYTYSVLLLLKFHPTITDMVKQIPDTYCRAWIY